MLSTTLRICLYLQDPLSGFGESGTILSLYSSTDATKASALVLKITPVS